MTSNEPKRAPGYRGALPTRDDRLARPWLLLVIGVFVLIFVLSFLGIPSRLFPEATPIPLPSNPPASSSAPGSVEPSPTAE
ncbi:MAG: hypothetical protein ACRDGD_02630 [Candidatus Limnocylindria bacterium]